MSATLSIRILSSCLGASLTLVGLPARAQEPAPVGPAAPTTAATAPGEDIVTLKNGGMIRGRILEVIPDQSVTIVSAASGESKTFPWAEVASHQRGGEPAPVAAPAPAAAPVQEPQRPLGPRLHIEPSRDVTVDLFEITAEIVAHGANTTVRGIAYRPVCKSPCDAVIDAGNGQSFFFGGDGVTTSRRFTLLDQGNDVVAHVKPGRRGLRFGGLAMLSIGAAGILTGGVLFAFAGRKPLTRYDDMGQPIEAEFKPNYTPATALLVTGAALLIGGIVMYVMGRTTFKLSPRGSSLRGRLPRWG